MDNNSYLEPVIEEESIELEEDAVIISTKNTCNTVCSASIGLGLG